MALGADFYVDFFLSRTCYECVSTVAGYSCLMVYRMDSFLHDFHLVILFCELLFLKIPGQCRSDLSTTRYPGLSLQVPAVSHLLRQPLNYSIAIQLLQVFPTDFSSIFLHKFRLLYHFHKLGIIFRPIEEI